MTHDTKNGLAEPMPATTRRKDKKEMRTKRDPGREGRNSGWKSLSTLEVSPCQLHTRECDRARGGGAGARAHSSGFPLHGCKGNETTHQGPIILPSPSSGPRKPAVYSDPRDFAQDVPSTKKVHPLSILICLMALPDFSGLRPMLPFLTPCSPWSGLAIWADFYPLPFSPTPRLLSLFHRQTEPFIFAAPLPGVEPACNPLVISINRGLLCCQNTGEAILQREDHLLRFFLNPRTVRFLVLPGMQGCLTEQIKILTKPNSNRYLDARVHRSIISKSQNHGSNPGAHPWRNR